MSRCFPFPPPGYEQLAAANCAESPSKEKEKSKDKKKRDREKKEGKEKKHRDKSKEKHGDKKDRRDKDKEKDKHRKKDKNRNKDRGGLSNEKLLEEHSTTIGDGRSEVGNISDSRIRAELQSRIRDEKGAGKHQVVETTFGKLQGKNDGMLFESARQLDHDKARSPIDRQKQIERSSPSVIPGQKIARNLITPVFTGSVALEHNKWSGSSNFIAEKEIIIEKNLTGSSKFYAEKNAIAEQRNRSGASGFLTEKDVTAEQRNHMATHGLHGKDIFEQRNHSRTSGLLEKDNATERRNHNGIPGFLREKDFTNEHKNNFRLSGDVRIEQKNHVGSSGFLSEKGGTSEKRNYVGPSGLLPEKDDTTGNRNRFGPSVIPERDVITGENNCVTPSGSFPENDAFSDQKNRRNSCIFSERDPIFDQRSKLVPARSLPEKDVDRLRSSRSIPENNVILEQRNLLAPSGSFTGGDTKMEKINKIGTTGYLHEGDADVKLNGKEKIGVHAASPHKIEKHKNKEKKSKSKDGKERHKDKEKKKDKDRTIEKGERKDKERKLAPEVIKREEHLPDIKPALSLKVEEKNANVVGNLKRKELNGFLHENEVRPFKLQRTTPSPHLNRLPQVQNGRNLENNSVHIPLGLERPADATEGGLPVKPEPDTVDDRKVDVTENRERNVNGAVQRQAIPLTISKCMVADSTGVIDNEVLKKPPHHPDSKYLCQILSVPKMAEWPEFDEQEWLFGHGNSRRQKPLTKVDSDDTPVVWAKALNVEGADIIALPYVIPF